MNFKIQEDNIYEDSNFSSWKKRWEERVMENNNSSQKCMNIMKKMNPLVIPRNHQIEEVLKEASQGNLDPLNKFFETLNNPYSDHKNISKYQLPNSNENYQTFCGT
tara:strand:- start:376 stop:693 length:318 start_codon:yes stop_codon:yes gene_type:complete